MIKIAAEIDPADLADSITSEYDMIRDNYTKLLDFIEEIDNSINDLQFTVALRNRLNEVIEAESEWFAKR